MRRIEEIEPVMEAVEVGVYRGDGTSIPLARAPDVRPLVGVARPVEAAVQDGEQQAMEHRRNGWRGVGYSADRVRLMEDLTDAEQFGWVGAAAQTGNPAAVEQIVGWHCHFPLLRMCYT